MSEPTRLTPSAPRRRIRQGAGAMLAAGWLPAAITAIAAIAAAAAHAAEAPPLGRLFNTPQQRAQLDAQRQGTAQPAVTADTAPPPPPSPPPPPLVLNGVVRPAQGKATVWLNQEAVPDGQRIVGRDGKVTLILPSGRRVTLKPGQRYDEATGEVRNDSN
jgi:hypothetical protein